MIYRYRYRHPPRTLQQRHDFHSTVRKNQKTRTNEVKTAHLLLYFTNSYRYIEQPENILTVLLPLDLLLYVQFTLLFSSPMTELNEFNTLVQTLAKNNRRRRLQCL